MAVDLRCRGLLRGEDTSADMPEEATVRAIAMASLDGSATAASGFFEGGMVMKCEFSVDGLQASSVTGYWGEGAKRE